MGEEKGVRGVHREVSYAASFIYQERLFHKYADHAGNCATYDALERSIAETDDTICIQSSVGIIPTSHQIMQGDESFELLKCLRSTQLRAHFAKAELDHETAGVPIALQAYEHP
ncbi:hypothetical protein PSPO01_01451 [Paraphaeosphaeria sporulosa]